jgi:cyanophycinase
MRRQLRLVLTTFFLASLALSLAVRAAAPAPDAPEYGPAKGWLVIIGGNMQDGSGLAQKFIELAGGKDKNFVIIPTNNGNRNQDGSLHVYNEEQVLAPWIKRGLTHVKMLHTADPKVANTEEFVKPLLDANGVWFDGGRQWNGVDSYAGTRVVARSPAARPARRFRATTSCAATPRGPTS